MILTEQNYKKLNKLYYHGQISETRDPSFTLFNCYYLTTSPYYSYKFATANGLIKIHRLKKCLNICNLKSKKDRQIVEDYCRKIKIKEPLEFINNLSENDWLGYFKNGFYRDSF